MRNDLTDITLIVDRSGSMSTCKDEAQNGINHFIEEQKKVEGDALLTLVQFDTEYEFVHKGAPITNVGEYELVPRGMTALLDAVGRGINETGERLLLMGESERPGLVVFVITTDGMENSSHEFTRAQVKEMIERQQNEYNWQFIFLGANQDAFAEAASIGVNLRNVSNYDQRKSEPAYAAVSMNLGTARTEAKAGRKVDLSFSQQDRERMKQ